MVLYEPIVVYRANLLRYPADYYRDLRWPECIVVDFDRGPGNGRAVFAVASPMHVKTVAERFAEFDVVPGDVIASGPPGAGDGMAIPVE